MDDNTPHLSQARLLLQVEVNSDVPFGAIAKPCYRRRSTLERCWLFIEEAVNIFDTGCSPGGREGLEHQFAIAFGVEAGVENGHYAAIIAGAQEAPEALLEAQHRLGQHVNAKPVFVSCFICATRAS